MLAPQENGARAALTEFANGSSDKDRVMRALIAHEGWFVPAAFAIDALGLGVFDRTILLGAAPEAPPPLLTIFTDVESVLLAYGDALGPYVGGVSGLLTFAALEDALGGLRVNPASPRDEQWHVEREGLAICRLWAGAVALERDLAASAGGELPRKRLREYPGFSILVGKADRTPVMAPLGENGSLVALAFTAPDRAERFLARLPSEQRDTVTGAPLDGATLFAHLAQGNVAGVLLNSDDSASAVLIPGSEIAAIAGG